jgi:transposase
MANAKEISVKETVAELKSLLKKSSNIIRPRVQMLLVMKQSKKMLTKYELAVSVGVNHNSITTWRRKYEQDGISALLQHKQGGKRKEVIDATTHKAIEKRLTNPQEGFRSYKELQQWVDEHYIANIKYITIVKYVQNKFGAKLKTVRKSHINKDEQAISAFKKTSSGTSKAY